MLSPLGSFRIPMCRWYIVFVCFCSLLSFIASLCIQFSVIVTTRFCNLSQILPLKNERGHKRIAKHTNLKTCWFFMNISLVRLAIQLKYKLNSWNFTIKLLKNTKYHYVPNLSDIPVDFDKI